MDKERPTTTNQQTYYTHPAKPPDNTNFKTTRAADNASLSRKQGYQFSIQMNVYYLKSLIATR